GRAAAVDSLQKPAASSCASRSASRDLMHHHKLLTTLMMFATAASAAGLLAGASNGGAKAQRTIGLVFPDPNTGAPLSREVEHGGSAAASALGDDLVTIPADGPEAMTSAVKSLIAQHAAAI